MYENWLFYGFLFVLLLFCLKIYYESDAFQLKCIISTKDGQTYCVRDRKKLHKAANLLARVTDRCKRLVRYMQSKHPDDKRTIQLVDNFNPKNISETLPTSELEAYSENKGEKIAFCLNKNSKTGVADKLIDVETLTFVAIHELSHLMTESVGHKQEFWENFKFLLQNAKEAGIHHPVNYKSSPTDYCGMTITDSPYYDLV